MSNPRVPKKLQLREHEVEVSFLKGSGPGGQNRNKRETGVRVKHLPTNLVAMATERRSQAQNLEAALERLREKLEALYFVPEARVATKKTRSSHRKRLMHKKHRGDIKAGRREKSRWNDE